MAASRASSRRREVVLGDAALGLRGARRLDLGQDGTRAAQNRRAAFCGRRSSAGAAATAILRGG